MLCRTVITWNFNIVAPKTNAHRMATFIFKNKPTPIVRIRSKQYVLEFYRIEPYGLLCDLWHSNSMNNKSQVLLNRISTIRGEHDTEKRLWMLQQLNDSLSKDIKLDMPSLITNAYVRRALDMIEERLLVSA